MDVEVDSARLMRIIGEQHVELLLRREQVQTLQRQNQSLALVRSSCDRECCRTVASESNGVAAPTEGD